MEKGTHLEYDKSKNLTNIRKHGISFITASSAFDDSDVEVTHDKIHSDSEHRYNLIGAVGTHILFIVYTMGNC